MSRFIPCKKENPCPVCSDTSGKCNICEYGYLCICESRVDAKLGDLAGTWRCKKPIENDDGIYLWEDQRVILEAEAQASRVEAILLYQTNGRLLNPRGKAVPLEDARFRISSSHRGTLGEDLTYEEAQLLFAKLTDRKGGES